MSTNRLPTKKAALEFLRSLEEVSDPTWDAATREFAIALKTSRALQTVAFGKKTAAQTDIIDLAFALMANQERYLESISKGAASMREGPGFPLGEALKIEVMGPAQRKLVFLSDNCTNPHCVIHNFRRDADVRAHATRIIELVAQMVPQFPDLQYLRLLVADESTTCTRVPDGILLSGRVAGSDLN
jgi:hypothetical protein